MAADADKDKDGGGRWLASWRKALASEPLSRPGVREGCRGILERFLGYCRQKGWLPSVARAREYVEVARLEPCPGTGPVAGMEGLPELVFSPTEGVGEVVGGWSAAIGPEGFGLGGLGAAAH